jgi:hypothetical protein
MYEEKGWPRKKHGPLGRECDNLEEKQACRDVGEVVERDLQDFLKKIGIDAEVQIPFDYVGSVLNPVNVDVKIIAAYNGFNILYRLTLKERVKDKRKNLYGAIRRLRLGRGDPRKKLKVIGF